MRNNVKLLTVISVKLFIVVIFLIQVTGCATTGRKSAKMAEIVYKEGHAESRDKICEVGKNSKGDRIAVIYNQKTRDVYDVGEEGEVKKVEYDRNRRKFKVYHDGKCGNIPEFR